MKRGRIPHNGSKDDEGNLSQSKRRKLSENEFTHFLRRIDAEELTPELAEKIYLNNQFLWIRLTEKDRMICHNWNVKKLQEQHSQHSESFETNWSEENCGNHSRNSLTPDFVLNCSNLSKLSPFYVSTIIQKDDTALKRVFASLPFSVIPFLENLTHENACWIFFGMNVGPSALQGRAEHTDKVDHFGTWHLQLSGAKTWVVRPDSNAEDWTDGVPDISKSPLVEMNDRGGQQLRIVVEEGDLFILNTTSWFHRTELPASKEPSVSVARDFYFNMDEVTEICPHNVKEGELIFEDDSHEIAESKNGNCSLAEIEISPGEIKIGIVALQDIQKGENLLLNIEEDSSELFNQADGIDPRWVAKSSFGENVTVLVGEEIPEMLPRSLEPNCELVESEDGMILRSLVPLQPGDVFSILADDTAEYESIEIDTSTGNITYDNS